MIDRSKHGSARRSMPAGPHPHAPLRRRALALLLTLAYGFAAGGVGAASYPVRPVRIITTSLPGSATDVAARAIAARLTEHWGQQFIVDNRAGAGGQIAAELASRAAPDGYTLFFTSDGPLAISPAMRRNVPYDPLKDFEPVAFAAYNEYILVVHPSVPATSVAELVKLAKASPGKLRYGTAGVGSPNHMGMELFKLRAGIDITHVPYKGGPAATADLVAGHIEVAMLGPPSIPHVKAGRLRAIAAPSSRRAERMPELPPIADTVPGVDVRTWGAFFAPAGTPPALLDTLHAEINRALGEAATRKLFASQGLRVEAMERMELGRLLAADIRKHREVAKALEAAGARPTR